MTYRCILIILFSQFVLAIIPAIIGTITAQTSDNLKYLTQGLPGQTERKNAELFIQLVGSWILMLTNFVPISLMVSLEIVKYWQGMFMSTDFLMYDQE